MSGGVTEVGEAAASITAERQRELAVEHLLFQTLLFVEERHPGLFDRLETSLEHLGDRANDGTKDDEAVREVARRFVDSLRATAR